MKKKIPTSSYRIQLSKSFGFKEATAILPYLKKLGVELIYTSPYFEVVKGSNNPYMIITPLMISQELGGEEGFETFCKSCQKNDIMHMMDIVPNHMAAHAQNPWWNDVLEKRQESRYASFFDIDWEWGDGKVVRPDTCFNIHAEINYRRFFDICEMVGINIEHDDLYELYFSKISLYVKKGWIHGFRVDHIDGLRYPKKFLDRLHEDFPEQFVALEKIVQEGELIPSDLKCDGSVGYDVLYLIDQVLLDPKGEDVITKCYDKYKEEEVDLIQIKIDYLNNYLISEVNRFAKYFGVEKEQLLLFLAHFPLYRTYIDDHSISAEDKDAILHAAEFTTGNFFKEEIFEEKHRKNLLKLQQILPAVFAKGFEDTFNYRYVRLASLNEVGGEPEQYSISNERFHDRIKTLFSEFPNSMHTLSTHDTKRSLDARMRIHILSEIPDEFAAQLKHFMKSNNKFESKRCMYFFFQNFIAISGPDVEERMTNYMIKFAREGKYYSDYLNPDPEFEDRLKKWIKIIFENKTYLEEFLAFKQKVAKAAELKSLSALVLQMGLPGVMDIYQGEELINANLVDPDNRRPVDFKSRQDLIDTSTSAKMSLLKTGLNFRKDHRDLILSGTYEPLKTPDHQIGYTRTLGDQTLTVIVNKTHFEPALAPPKLEQTSIFPSTYPLHLSLSKYKSFL